MTKRMRWMAYGFFGLAFLLCAFVAGRRIQKRLGTPVSFSRTLSPQTLSHIQPTSPATKPNVQHAGSGTVVPLSSCTLPPVPTWHALALLQNQLTPLNKKHRSSTGDPIDDQVKAAAGSNDPIGDQVRAAAGSNDPIGDQVRAAAGSNDPIGDQVKAAAGLDDPTQAHLQPQTNRTTTLRQQVALYRNQLRTAEQALQRMMQDPACHASPTSQQKGAFQALLLALNHSLTVLEQQVNHSRAAAQRIPAGASRK